MRKGTISWQIFSSDYAGFRIFRSVHIFAANLGRIAHYVAEIQLFFHPEQRKLRSPKRQFLYANNFSVYGSVTRCMHSDPRPRGFVVTRDVGQGKKVTASHTCTFMNYITCVCQSHEINIWSVPFLYTHNTHMYIWEQITASISDIHVHVYTHKWRK